MNKVSKKLLNKLGIVPLKKGEKKTFEVLGIAYDQTLKRTVIPAAVNVPNTDRIWDEFAEDENGNPIPGGDFVDIGYVKSERPGGVNDKNPSYKELGSIDFLRENHGQIIITAEDKLGWDKYLFLKLTNHNSTNENANPGSHKIFKEVEAGKTAAEKREKDKMVRFAQELVDQMSSNELQEAARGLFIPIGTDDEIVLALNALAVKSPEKVMNLSTDHEMKAKAITKEAEDARIIVYKTEFRTWEFTDTNSPICVVAPGQNKYDAMVMLFAEAPQTKKTFEKALAGLKAEANAAPKTEVKQKVVAVK
jgi:hypothetical protein